MPNVKTFRVTEDAEEAPPKPFALEFISKDPEAEPRVEQFEAYGKAPAGATLALSSMIHYDARGRQKVDMNGMVEFFERVLPPTEFARFSALLDSPDWMIGMDTVGDVFSWLTEEYTGRPTRRSRRSSRLRPVDGRSEHDAATEPLDEVSDSLS